MSLQLHPSSPPPSPDVLVVGGGLAGLSAALWLSRGGRSVTVLERSRHLGGRATTRQEGGFSLNLGPHALYKKGAALAAFKELGVPVSGKDPGTDGEVLHGTLGEGAVLLPFPTTPSGLVSSALLGWGARAEYAWVVGKVLAMDLSPWEGRTVNAWLSTIEDPSLRAWMAALVRVSTYTNAPDLQDARSALSQLRRSFSGVLYLDGGWQPLVDSLRSLAEAAGVTIRCGVDVTAADSEGVTMDGRRETANDVLLALPLAAARSLLPASSLPNLPKGIPVNAACLDLALSRLPVPRRRFVLGTTEPWYCGVHSLTARVAPEGGALIHAARYLSPGEHGSEAALEALVDIAQPGWRDHVVYRRYLPTLQAASALDEATRPRHPGQLEGVWLAGDWVGPEGLLADASMASARAAAMGILSRASRRAAA